VQRDGPVVPTLGFLELLILRVCGADGNVPKVLLALGADSDRKFGQRHQIRFVRLEEFWASIQSDQPLVARTLTARGRNGLAVPLLGGLNLLFLLGDAPHAYVAVACLGRDLQGALVV